MDTKRQKEILAAQLELLSERSKERGADLPALTQAMCEVSDRLLSFFSR